MKTNKIITSIASALTVSMIVSGCEYSVEDINNTLQDTTVEVQEKNEPGTYVDQEVPEQEAPVQVQQAEEEPKGESPPVSQQLKEIEVQVSSSSDDAEENSEGEVNLRSTDLEMVVDRGMPQSVGIRFAHVFIPQGAKITKASIVFTTDERTSDATDLKIQIEDSTNAEEFNNRLYNITSRDLVDIDVSWQPEAWEVAGESGPAQTTPDLSALVQQIVDKDEWYNGNAMAFVISGEGSRVAQSFNGSQKGAPILHISYMADEESTPEETDIEEKQPEAQEPGYPQDQGTNVDKEVPQGGFEGENGTDDETEVDREDPNTNGGNQNKEPNVDNGSDENGNIGTDNGSDNGSDNTVDTEATPEDPATPLVDYPRISWDLDPAHRAIIGFTPTKRGSYSVHYGYSTDESTWESKAVTSKETFDRSMNNEFVKLTGLQADKDIYFRICNDTQCGERMWFKTAPTETKDFVFVAGGDTRTGWDIRQAANKMISKIRPLFVMHGGDHTNGNEAKEMKQWLEDWTLAYSHDTIDGKSYTRVYPIVPAHGNHEDGNLNTLCEVYGIDPNDDGVCDEKDTYGAFNVGKQLRVYTLNSQFKYSSRSSYATPMNDWLRSDLANEGTQTQWRVVQYHKPMFPHYTGKHSNPTLHEWWAQLFYDRSVNLVVESDTHIAKATTTVKPDGDGFVATNNGGTLYVGEGSWGAPARSANQPYDWTLDLASIQQVKVITVTSNSMDVRTAEFDGNVNALSREDRMQDSTKLPTGIKWWSIKDKGTVLKLTQTREKRSLLE